MSSFLGSVLIGSLSLHSLEKRGKKECKGYQTKVAANKEGIKCSSTLKLPEGVTSSLTAPYLINLSRLFTTHLLYQNSALSNTLLTFCILGNFSCLCCHLLILSKLTLMKFKTFFKELYQNVKQFGLITETNIMSVLIWVQIVCNGYQQTTFFLFCCFTSQVKSYGHGGTVSSPNHTFSWASLNKTKLCPGPASWVHIVNVFTFNMKNSNKQG